jgi:hypothetical protein
MTEQERLDVAEWVRYAEITKQDMNAALNAAQEILGYARQRLSEQGIVLPDSEEEA